MARLNGRAKAQDEMSKTKPAAAQKTTRANARAQAEKENHPQLKIKKTVNINTIYDAPQSLKRKHRDEVEAEIEAEAHAAIASTRKPLVAEPGFFARRLQEKEQQPSAKKGFFNVTQSRSFGFGDAFQPYWEAVDASFEDRWAAWQQETKNREEGLDENGNLLQPPIPSEADIDALRLQLLNLSKPLEDDIMTVTITQSDGSIVPQSIPLGRTLDAFNERCDKKRGEIAGIAKKLAKVEKEMSVLKQELLTESTSTTEANKKLQAQMQTFEQEMEKIEQQAEAELVKMKKEQRAAKKEFDRKLKAFMETAL